MTTYVLISKYHLQARAKQLETNVFMTKYVLISKCHLQARAGGGEVVWGGDTPRPTKMNWLFFLS